MRGTHIQASRASRAWRAARCAAHGALWFALSGAGANHTHTGRPCAACVRALARAGIDRLPFCEGTADGLAIRNVTAAPLAATAPTVPGAFARHMRLPRHPDTIGPRTASASH